MIRIDNKRIPSTSTEIRLFSAMRNETLRLPFWLEHYRTLGVDRFFIVDNGSEDGTRERLLEESDVHVFHTPESFADADYGRLWFRDLMIRHAEGGWCVVADGDEFLAPPYWECLSLRPVVDFLDSEGAEALPCYLLDLYSPHPIRDTVLSSNLGPFEACRYFDPDFRPKEGVFREGDAVQPLPTVVGSTREKVFGIQAYLSKVALLRFRPDVTLTSGQHGIIGARVSEIRGVMFHFKFLADFAERAVLEVDREERRTHNHEWDAYVELLAKDPALSLFDQRSVRLRDSHQLLDLGIMRTTAEYDAILQRSAPPSTKSGSSVRQV